MGGIESAVDDALLAVQVGGVLHVIDHRRPDIDTVGAGVTVRRGVDRHRQTAVAGLDVGKRLLMGVGPGVGAAQALQEIAQLRRFVADRPLSGQRC